MSLFIEIVGWAGAVVILAAYSFHSLGRLDGASRSYQYLNILGAAAIAINSGWNGAMPSAILNVIWAAIAAFAIFGRRKAETQS